MCKITLRFYSRLNDFLEKKLRHSTIEASIDNKASIKDIIESFNVPHVEVGLIILNGGRAGFGRCPVDGDRVSVYPHFMNESFTACEFPGTKEAGGIKFAADVNLGRLASYLRLFGFDTYYYNNSTDEALAEVSRLENRMLVTRDVGLLKRKIIERGYFVRETDIRKQASEVLNRFDLFDKIKLFTRCSLCNSALYWVEKEKVAHRLLPATIKYFNEFYACGGCSKIYWKGSHYENMLRFLSSLH